MPLFFFFFFFFLRNKCNANVIYFHVIWYCMIWNKFFYGNFVDDHGLSIKPSTWSYCSRFQVPITHQSWRCQPFQVCISHHPLKPSTRSNNQPSKCVYIYVHTFWLLIVACCWWLYIYIFIYLCMYIYLYLVAITLFPIFKNQMKCLFIFQNWAISHLNHW